MTRPTLLVLVAHEDAASRDAARDALRWDGCEVIAASTSTEALDRTIVSSFDVAVLSTSVAGTARDGPLAKALARTPVVALGVARAPTFADAVLREPVDALELIAVVRVLAAR